jgi:hypothetical protein
MNKNMLGNFKTTKSTPGQGQARLVIREEDLEGRAQSGGLKNRNVKLDYQLTLLRL